MKTHRIAFTKENRAASREGRKTQTRRVMVPQPHLEYSPPMRVGGQLITRKWRWGDDYWFDTPTHGALSKAPYQPGDILAMLEPVRVDMSSPGEYKLIGQYLDTGDHFDTAISPSEWAKWRVRKRPYAPTPARFMYTSLARTFFRVESVRAERLQDISEEDATAEGVIVFEGEHGPLYQDYSKENYRYPCFTARDSFLTLWDSINAHRHPAANNPWVWAYTYQLAEAPTR